MNFPPNVHSFFILLFLLNLLVFSSHSDIIAQDLIISNDHDETLKNIYEEVLELGKREGEDFIKREFFIDLDGDEINKEEQVVVLSYDDGNRKKMIIQVTYFQPRKNNRFIKHAADNKTVLCFIVKGSPQIKSSDFEELELNTILPGILNGIRDKKKLLQLIRNK